MKLENNQEIAAAKAGMDRKTARKYLRARRLPSELPQAPRWRTRADAFEEVWGDLKELLTVNPGLEAKTLFDYLQRQYPGRFQDGQLRTLQRRASQRSLLGVSPSQRASRLPSFHCNGVRPESETQPTFAASQRDYR